MKTIRNLWFWLDSVLFGWDVEVFSCESGNVRRRITWADTNSFKTNDGSITTCCAHGYKARRLFWRRNK